ncbi:putative phosphatidylserine decarboxylase [Proteus penneri ATCC 35198]|nr:putative phosphatidylserine decarboxylase [Proteus penneri ATCC 35198]
MNEAKDSQFQAYSTFNDFFIRALKDGARPIIEGNDKLALPADGAVSQLGPIQDDQILQAKGHHYTLEALLAGNFMLADKFRNGQFITTYLSPRDYHRVHMPCDGLLKGDDLCSR